MSFQRRLRVAFVRIDRFAKIASSPGLRCIAGENFQTTERNFHSNGEVTEEYPASGQQMRNKTSLEPTKAATTTETTQVPCRHTVTVTASDFHFARDWTLDRPGSREIFYDSPVDMYCHVYGVRCTVFVSANELAAQTSRVSGERANEYPVRSFQH